MNQNELIEKLYREGKSRLQIAKETGLTPGQVQYRIYSILKLNIDAPRNTFTLAEKGIDREKVNRIVMLTSWGYRDKEIAEDQGITPTIVRQVIEENLHRIVKKV